MPRAINGTVRKKRVKKILKRAKGFFVRRKVFKMANQSVYRAMAFEFFGRKQRKRNFRKLWNVRIGLAARLEGISYSTLMYGLKLANIKINRKMLAELAVNNSADFKEIVNTAKNHLKK